MRTLLKALSTLCLLLLVVPAARAQAPQTLSQQGYLDLQNPSEGGTRDVFGLPSAAAEPAEPPLEDPTPIAPTLVLVADDDPNVRRILRRALDDASSSWPSRSST